MCSRNNKNNYSVYGDYGMNPGYNQGYNYMNNGNNRQMRMQGTGTDLISITRNMVNDNGQLLNTFGTPYTFVMIKSANCGYCKMAAPEFYALSNALSGNKKFTVATVEADKERELYMLLSKIFGLRGVPVYLLFLNGRRIAEYSGDRTRNDMITWLNKF